MMDISIDMIFILKPATDSMILSHIKKSNTLS